MDAIIEFVVLALDDDLTICVFEFNFLGFVIRKPDPIEPQINISITWCTSWNNTQYPPR